jgi:hypothetical protein
VAHGRARRRDAVLDRATGAPRRYIGVKSIYRYDQIPGRLRRSSSVCVFGKRVAVLDRAKCGVAVFETATGTYVNTMFPDAYLFPISIASSPHGQLAVYYCPQRKLCRRRLRRGAPNGLPNSVFWGV